LPPDPAGPPADSPERAVPPVPERARPTPGRRSSLARGDSGNPTTTGNLEVGSGLESGETTVVSVGDRAEGYDSARPADEPLPRARHRTSGKAPSIWRELPILLVIAIVLAFVIKTFLVQAFYIPSGSMEQTLHINDRVLVNKVVFHLRDPHRGEIVVFDTKGTGFEGQGSDFAACGPANGFVEATRGVQRFLGMGSCGDNDFIKRVIAVPGDTVQCCTANNQVIVNGKPLTEKYLYEDNHEAFCAAPAGSLRPAALGPDCLVDPKPITVPPGKYWVMGDHRGNSDDSRPNGFVPGDKIVGRAFIRVWPPSRIAFLHVPSSFGKAAAIGIDVAATPVLSAPMLFVPLIGGRRWSRRRAVRRARVGAGES
jgi:signal peptidase I